MRIAFCGLPLAALLLAADGHQVVHAAICRRGALGTRRLRRVIGASRVELVPDLASEAAAQRFRDLAPDLIVSWFWTRRIPPRVLAAGRLGAIGVHPSLLPRHRGPDPVFWTLASGDAVAGVTAHLLDAGYDTGAVLARESLAIDPSWDAWALARRLDRPSLRLLRRVALAYARGEPPAPIAQDEALATHAPAPSDDDSAIHWREPAGSVVRLVRAAAPWPGAFTHLVAPHAAIDGEPETVVVTRAEVTRDVPAALQPGEAAVVGGRVVVRAGDTGVALLAGRLVGDGGDGEEEPLDAAGIAALLAST